MHLSQNCGRERSCTADESKGRLGKDSYCLNKTLSNEHHHTLVEDIVRSCESPDNGLELPFKKFLDDLFGLSDHTKHEGSSTAPLNCEKAAEALKAAEDAHQKALAAWSMHKSEKNLSKVAKSYKKVVVLAAELMEACSGLSGSSPSNTGGISTKTSDRAQCGPIQHAIGEPCLQDLEGQTHCDYGCTKIVSSVPVIHEQMSETY